MPGSRKTRPPNSKTVILLCAAINLTVGPRLAAWAPESADSPANPDNAVAAMVHPATATTMLRIPRRARFMHHSSPESPASADVMPSDVASARLVASPRSAVGVPTRELGDYFPYSAYGSAHAER